MVDIQNAESIAREFLTKKGIQLIGCGKVKKVDGGLRQAHLPARTDDFWLVTFRRSTSLVEDASQLNAEELEILTAVAEENDSITVAVDKDGSVEVV